MTTEGELTSARRYQTTILRLADRSAIAALRAWDALDAYDNPAAFAALVGDTLDAAAATAAETTTGWLSAYYAADITPADVKPLDLARPFKVLGKALDDGHDWARAVAMGRTEAEAVGYDATVHASRDAMAAAADRSQRWRRVPNPGACDWCLLVADQSYRTQASATFGHSKCGCIVLPSDVGARLTAERGVRTGGPLQGTAAANVRPAQRRRARRAAAAAAENTAG